MVLKIVKYGDPVLERPALDVSNFATPELRDLVSNMFETMYANKGVGLAAPQVGLSLRLFIIDTSAGEEPGKRLVFINPEILDKKGSQVGEEGCLSFPGFREDVKRSMHVKVRARDVEGNTFELEGEELLARAILHENDHLNGDLFINHMSALKRDLIRRKIRKLTKLGDW